MTRQLVSATMSFSPGTKQLKKRIKGYLKKIRVAYFNVFWNFSTNDLEGLLRNLSLHSGDTVMVHSSYDSFIGFQGQPADVIETLQTVVGERGTLLMPTMPFTGTAVEYVAREGIFDVRRTPSQMGLITEMFRRSLGVIRSVHPTHPVAVWGKNAEDLVRNHHVSKTPCGRETPFGRLADVEGKILLLGTGIEAMTFFHSMEEQLESLMPFSPFTKETFMLRSRDQNGQILETTNRLFDPTVSRRRNLRKLIPVLKECGYWNEGRVGNLEVIMLKAQEVALACRSMAEKGQFCYDS